MIDVSKASLLRDPGHLSEICHRPVRAERGFDEVWIACSGPAAVIAWNTGLAADTVKWDDVRRLLDVRPGPEPLGTTVGAVRRWAPEWSDDRPCEDCGSPANVLCPRCWGTGRAAGRTLMAGIVAGRQVDRDLVARCLCVVDVADEEDVGVSWSDDCNVLVLDGLDWRALIGGMNTHGSPPEGDVLEDSL